MVAKMGIILTKEQQEKLRKQELQAQIYSYYTLERFLDQSEQIKKILELDDKTFRRYNYFDTSGYIITTLGPGVYIFFQDRKIQYIGSSKEMRIRIKKHIKKKDRKRYHADDRIITIGTMTWEDAKVLEDWLIIVIKPPRNRKKTLQGKDRY